VDVSCCLSKYGPIICGLLPTAWPRRHKQQDEQQTTLFVPGTSFVLHAADGQRINRLPSLPEPNELTRCTNRHGRRAEGHWVYVWSDLACPQCYVGKQRLDRALAAYSPLKGRRIDVRWHAFMIDTASAPAGVRYQAYCERRWGGDGCCAMAGFPHGCASAACPASFYCFFCCQA